MENKHTLGPWTRSSWTRFASIVPAFGLLFGTSYGASFTLLEETRFSEWRAVHYENNSSGQQFCALESVANHPLLRISQYLSDNDTFLEVYDPNWTKVEGAVSFSLQFDAINDVVPVIELQGKSWGDAYTYDILEEETYLVLIGALMMANDVAVVDSNGRQIAAFNLAGSARAARVFGQCLGR